MAGYVVLLRAVNVGKRQVRMADLRAWLSTAGYGEVLTHIQTGNLYLPPSPVAPDADTVQAGLEELLHERCGFAVPSFVFGTAEFADLAAWANAQPVPEAGDLKRYVSFFAEPLGAQQRDAIEAYQPPEGEGVTASTRAVHLWCRGSFQDFQSMKALKAQLDPGTNRNLAVTTTLARTWCTPETA